VEERFRSNPLTLQVEQGGAAIVLVGSQERDDPHCPVTLTRSGAGYYRASVALENAVGRQSQYEFTVYVMSLRTSRRNCWLGGDCTTTARSAPSGLQPQPG
jgi:hypothetical protein